MRTRGKRVLLLAAVIVVAVGATVWWVSSSRRGDITVGSPDGSSRPRIVCSGDAVRERYLGGVGRRLVMPARPGMDCRMPLVVTNTSSSTVRLEAIILPFMGPQAGGEVQVTRLAGLRRAPGLSEDGLDAAFRVDRDLAAGDSYPFTVRFTFRDSGCSGGRGGATWYDDFPRLRVSSLGLVGEVTGGVVAVEGSGQASGCHD